MTRLPGSFVTAVFLLAWLCPLDAGAVDLPTRKAGLWEMKLVRTGSSMPDMTMQHCTDATTDKQMSTSFSPGKETVCGFAGTTITSHAEITGDFNSAYTVKSTSHSERGPTGAPRDSTTTIEAKWLGACKPDQKPGDIVMHGGMKMNIMDLEKLKAMVPKAPPK